MFLPAEDHKQDNNNTWNKQEEVKMDDLQAWHCISREDIEIQIPNIKFEDYLLNYSLC